MRYSIKPVNVSSCLQRFFLRVSKMIVYALFFLFCSALESQTLSDYLAQVIENNPDVKGLELAHKAEINDIKTVSKLPPLSFEAGYFMSPSETRVGPQIATFSVNQEVPWLGAAKAQKRVRESKVAMAGNQLAVKKRSLQLALKKEYYRLFELKAKIKLLEQKSALLKRQKELMKKAIETNNSSMAAVFKITMSKNDIDNQIEQHKGALLNSESTFYSLLGTNEQPLLVIPDNLVIPDEEPVLSLDEAAYHPELIRYDRIRDGLFQKDTVYRIGRIPAFAVGFDYIVVQKRNDILVKDNGRDIMMPNITIKLPIFSTSYKSKKAVFAKRLEAIEQHRIAHENKLGTMLETAINNRISARIDYDTQLNNLEELKQLSELVLTQRQKGKTDFEAVLATEVMLLDIKINRITAIANYFQETAVINYLMAEE